MQVAQGHRGAQSVFGGAGGEVGVMVLDRDAGEGLGPGPLGGEVAGVQIVCDGLRLQAGEVFEVVVRLGEG
ncbi:hypothetical protein ADK54_30835, partial [Streptomyces sp. WM6378]